jgi:hypothetical protein
MAKHLPLSFSLQLLPSANNLNIRRASPDAYIGAIKRRALRGTHRVSDEIGFWTRARAHGARLRWAGVPKSRFALWPDAAGAISRERAKSS